MLSFFQKIKEAIDNQIPTELLMSDYEFRNIIQVHDIAQEDATHQKAINKAIHRIILQLGYIECSSYKVSILLYPEDIAALKVLLNNHCLMIAELYPETEGILAFFAEQKYEYYTNLMLKLK